MLVSSKDSSERSIFYTFYKQVREQEVVGVFGTSSVPLSSWFDDFSILRVGDWIQEDFLVLSIEPFEKFFDRVSFLTPIEVLDSRRQQDYDLGILLEHKEGFRVLGIIKYRKFRLWPVFPEIGSMYRFSGFMERWVNGIKGDKFVCWGFRLEGIES